MFCAPRCGTRETTRTILCHVGGVCFFIPSRGRLFLSIATGVLCNRPYVPVDSALFFMATCFLIFLLVC